jgi:hypothetical protein
MRTRPLRCSLAPTDGSLRLANTGRRRRAVTVAAAVVVVMALTVTLRAAQHASRSTIASCRVGAGSAAYTAFYSRLGLVAGCTQRDPLMA